MASGITVDANVMATRTKALLQGAQNDCRTLIDRVSACQGFVIDEGGKIERQWLDTCGSRPGTLFFEWFYQNVKEGKIRKVLARLDPAHKRALRVDCGFPCDRFEMAYVAVANVTEERYIVTGDIHFFEPALKRADEASKRRAFERRDGRVCRYLRGIGVSVGTAEQALVELFAGNRADGAYQ